MNKMKYLTPSETIADARLGADIVDCIREAIVLAVEEQRLVSFKHNGRKYQVDPDVLENTIAEQAVEVAK